MYVDYAATTPLLPSVKKYIIEMLDKFGNPSSMHSIGFDSKQIINNARDKVAKFINADTDNIYFTSGGSASNTLGIKGYTDTHCCDVLYIPIAHKSILLMIDKIPYTSSVDINKNGEIDLIKLEKQLQTSRTKPFVVVEYANSEIGTVQDIKTITELVHKYHGVIYVDCTGSISTIPLDVKALDIDMCGFSAHKIGALKGCGVFYKKENINISSLIYGNQEHGLFGGTENVVGIASLMKAIEVYNYKIMTTLCRDYVWNFIYNHIPNVYIIGSQSSRLANNLYICIKGISGETLTVLLDAQNIQVSTGSACNSGLQTPSNTLTKLNIPSQDVHSCIRISFSGFETINELYYLCDNIKKTVESLREFCI